MVSGFEAAIASRWDDALAGLHNEGADSFAAGLYGWNCRVAKLHRAAAAELVEA